MLSSAVKWALLMSERGCNWSYISRLWSLQEDKTTNCSRFFFSSILRFRPTVCLHYGAQREREREREREEDAVGIPAVLAKCFTPAVFKLFCSSAPRRNFSSTLYPQSCWCIIEVTHTV
jgi:hypothetical protein